MRSRIGIVRAIGVGQIAIGMIMLGLSPTQAGGAVAYFILVGILAIAAGTLILREDRALRRLNL